MFSKSKPFGKEEETFHLPIEITLYVPSTNVEQKKISSQDFRSRITRVRSKLVSLFQGYTRVQGKGSFTLKSGETIEEDVVKVTSFTKKGLYEKHKKDLLDFIHSIKKDWGQESIGYEIEGDMHFVE